MAPTPTYCTLTHVKTISPTPTDPTLIFYNGDVLTTWTIYGINISLADIYTIGYYATDAGGNVHTGWTFNLNVINPCLTATFDIDSTILSSNTIAYKVFDPIKTEVIDPSKVS